MFRILGAYYMIYCTKNGYTKRTKAIKLEKALASARSSLYPLKQSF